MEEFRVETRPIRGDKVVVEVSGDVDVYSAPTFREKLLEQINHGSYELIVDLANVTFLDSTGLAVMIGALKRVREHEGTLSLVKPTPQVLRILSVTDLDKVLPVYGSAEEAAADGSTSPAGR